MAMPSETEIARRYAQVRKAMAEASLSAVVVCGSEYTGFEGAVRYMCGFRILHRYAYAVLLESGEPCAVFPSEARYVGAHSEAWVKEKVFADHPGSWIRDYLLANGVKRVGVYGLNYIMPVRDWIALADSEIEVVDFDDQFDLARSVKSSEELVEVKDAISINEAGFWAVHEAYQPGKLSQADLLARAEAEFLRLGTGRQTMNMLLWGHHGAAEPEFRIPEHSHPVVDDDLLLFSLEIAGPGGYWSESARPMCRGRLTSDTQLLLEAYAEYFEAAEKSMKLGMTAHDVHRAVSKPFLERGFKLGHVTGHSIGTTMIEHPRIGEGVEVELAEGMVISMHPHAITADGKACMYMQDTWLVTADQGQRLSTRPPGIFDGSEERPVQKGIQ